VSSSRRFKLLNKLIYIIYAEKINWDFNQKPFSRNPFLNLLEFFVILLSIFDLGRRERLKALSSFYFYFVFIMPFSRMFCVSLNRFEKGLLSVLIKFDIGYVNFSNRYFRDYLEMTFSELNNKSINPS
jgi:hypothetical protein